MSYILILQEANFLPHAVRLEADTPQAAVTELYDVVASKNLAVAQWLIELATGEARRVFISDGQVILSDTGFRSDLGIATTPDYFMEESCD